jgi:hypothetical protein
VVSDPPGRSDAGPAMLEQPESSTSVIAMPLNTVGPVSVTVIRQ